MAKKQPKRKYVIVRTYSAGVFAGELGRLRLRLPLPNVWLGVSFEDQRRADERIPPLSTRLTWDRKHDQIPE